MRLTLSSRPWVHFGIRKFKLIENQRMTFTSIGKWQKPLGVFLVLIHFTGVNPAENHSFTTNVNISLSVQIANRGSK